MQKQILKALLTLLLVTILTSCNTEKPPELVAEYEKGEVLTVEDVYGIFFVYAPTAIPPKPDLLVLVHGTPAETWSVDEQVRFWR